MAVDMNKISAVADILRRIDKLLEKNENSAEIRELTQQLEEITGRKNIDPLQFRGFWTYTGAETLAEELLMPEPRIMGLSDEQIFEKVKKICLADYSEAECNYWIKVLGLETGLEISDYIYFPDTKGLDFNSDEREITNAILADRK